MLNMGSKCEVNIPGALTKGKKGVVVGFNGGTGKYEVQFSPEWVGYYFPEELQSFDDETAGCPAPTIELIDSRPFLVIGKHRYQLTRDDLANLRMQSGDALIRLEMSEPCDILNDLTYKPHHGPLVYKSRTPVPPINPAYCCKKWPVEDPATQCPDGFWEDLGPSSSGGTLMTTKCGPGCPHYSEK